MANKVKEEKKRPVRFILSILLYLVMLVLICIFFTGHGAFIYEAF